LETYLFFELCNFLASTLFVSKHIFEVRHQFVKLIHQISLETG